MPMPPLGSHVGLPRRQLTNKYILLARGTITSDIGPVIVIRWTGLLELSDPSSTKKIRQTNLVFRFNTKFLVIWFLLYCFHYRLLTLEYHPPLHFTKLYNFCISTAKLKNFPFERSSTIFISLSSTRIPGPRCSNFPSQRPDNIRVTMPSQTIFFGI